MLDLYFVRHGRTEANRRGRLAGRTDYPVLPESEEELRRLAEAYVYPMGEIFYRSPLQRCLQTLQCLYPGAEAQVVDDLIEIDFGAYEDQHAPGIIRQLGVDRFVNRDLTLQFPGGESFADCLGRGHNAMDLILADMQQRQLNCAVVVGHSVFFSVLMQYCNSETLSREELFCPNGMGLHARVDPTVWKKDRIVHFGGLIPPGAPREKVADSPYAAHNAVEDGAEK